MPQTGTQVQATFGGTAHRLRLDLRGMALIHVLLWSSFAILQAKAAGAADWLSVAEARLAVLSTNGSASSLERSPRQLADLSAEDLSRHFQEQRKAASARRERRAWQQVEKLARQCCQARNPVNQAELAKAIQEIAAAIAHEQTSPVPAKVDTLLTSLAFWKYAFNPVGRGTHPASNLLQTNAPDLSLQQPGPSTFWTPPREISQQDLYAGFGRSQIPNFDSVIWDYHEPKTGSGAHPGFVVRAAGRELKVKFGEVHSEPFAARIFDALGYHVPAIDFAPQLRMRYDRRLFREFHQRQELKTQLTALGLIPIYTIRYQHRFDPFSFITAAVLKDGSRLSPEEFHQHLLPATKPTPYPEDDPANFDPAFEAMIDYLVLSPANVEEAEAPGHALGRWSFGDQGHQDLRELRGLGLLAGWLCWFDSRTINTRLRIIDQKSNVPQLVHCLTDIGGCLGRSSGFMLATWENPDDFGWRFTRPQRIQGLGRMTIPFRVVNYQPIVETPAFREMTRDDARWMARLIGQLTEDQIVGALIAAGFDSAATRLYAEKLIARRDWLVRDLDLGNEIPLLRPTAIDQHFDYDPHTASPISAARPDGGRVIAPVGQGFINQGRLTIRPCGVR